MLQCNTAARNSLTEWSKFDTRQGLTLKSAYFLFQNTCDLSKLDKTRSRNVFEHGIFRHSSGTTNFFLQVSLYNPDLAALRFAVGAAVMVLNGTHARTNTGRPLSLEGPFEGPNEYTDSSTILRPRQFQEMHVSIDKNGNECTMRLVHNSHPPDSSENIDRAQLFQCDAESVFYVHGSQIMLHSVVVQVDNRREAVWDFSLQSALPDKHLCGVCPHGSKYNRQRGQCTTCLSGFHVLVNKTSPWWYNPDRSLAAIVVPEPDWAVLEVNNTRQSVGIMRHSSNTDHGNMILTPTNKIYAYETADSLPRVCQDSYTSQVRVDSGKSQSICDVGLFLREGVHYVGLIHTETNDISVRELLLQLFSWSKGDTVEFCEHQEKAPLVLHSCVNRIVMTFLRQNHWQPTNVDPKHYKYTRYTILSKKRSYVKFS